MPLLKAEREKAASIKIEKKPNKTFKLLWNTLLFWDLEKGVPTNADLAAATGVGLSTIEVYSPRLKSLKKKIRTAIKNTEEKTITPHFAPFDSKGFVNNDPDEADEVQNELIMDLQCEGIGYDDALEKVA